MKSGPALSNNGVAVRIAVRGVSARKSVRRAQTRRMGPIRTSAAVQEDAIGGLGAELGAEFRPVHEDFGADILNLNVEKGMSDAEGMLLKKALDVYKLVRIRGQDLNPDNITKVMRHLPHDKEAYMKDDCASPLSEKIPGYPWLVHRANNMEVKDYYGVNHPIRSPIKLFKDTGLWHMDLDYLQCPPEYSMMHMTTTPPTGGQTLFASTVKAYEMLSTEQKSQAHELIVEIIPRSFMGDPEVGAVLKMKENGTEIVDECFEVIKSLAAEHQESMTGNPLVAVDPETGEKSLLTSPFRFLRFKGMDFEESRKILEQYLRPVLLDGNVWTADWEEGDFVIWKNRQLIHSPAPWREYEGLPRAFNISFWQSDRPVRGINAHNGAQK